jgi:hypothetical protein
MNLKWTAVGALCLLAAQSQAQEGAFGFQMGAKPEAFPGCKKAAGSLYVCSTVPKPHPDFTEYAILAPAQIGICVVTARVAAIDNSSFGDKARSKAGEIADQISRNYGAARAIDTLKPGSIWSKPNDWLMGISVGERRYAFYWHQNTGATMKNDVEFVSLEVEAANRNVADLQLRFQFRNIVECREAIAKENASSF